MITQLAREGAEVRFTVVAADPDGDPVTLSVVGALPKGALFAPGRGELVWTPDFEQAGSHVIRFAAQDPSGTPVTMDVEIRVANVDRAPTLHESDHAFLIGQSKSFAVAAADPDAGTALKFSAIGLPEGATLDPDSGLFSWSPAAGQIGQYFVTLLVNDGQLSARQTVVLRASLEPTAPLVHIEVTPSFPALPGQAVLVHATADSFSDIASLQLFVDGTQVTLDANGRAHITADAPGKLDLLAIAIDADGVEGHAIAQLKVRDGADKQAPIVSLAPALNNAVLAQPTSILGSVQDTNLDFWRLEIAPGFSGEFHALAEGDTAIDGVLGTLDPHALSNGFYALRLTARDIGGRTSVADTRIEVHSAEKAAHYVRDETDLTLVLGGVPFTLARHYDSLENAQGTFGAGWSLPDRDVQLETNVEPTGREHLGVFNAFADGTRLYLTLPTGERMGFSFTPLKQTIGTVDFYRPAWTADEDHGWTLGSAEALLIKAGARYYDAASGLPYNPASSQFAGADYLLTGPNGTRYLIAPRADRRRSTAQEALGCISVRAASPARTAQRCASCRTPPAACCVRPRRMEPPSSTNTTQRAGLRVYAISAMAPRIVTRMKTDGSRRQSPSADRETASNTRRPASSACVQSTPTSVVWGNSPARRFPVISPARRQTSTRSAHVRAR